MPFPEGPSRDAVTELRMPSLGADMERGTLVLWKVKPGDTIERGDIVAEVETEKGVFEMEADGAGVVAELLVAPGTRTPVGAPLARLTGGRATPPAGAAPGPAAPRASPAARRLAAERGVELGSLVGTGRITRSCSLTSKARSLHALPKRPSRRRRHLLSCRRHPRYLSLPPPLPPHPPTPRARCGRRSPRRCRGPSGRSRTTT